MKRFRTQLLLFSAVVGIAIALAGALSALEYARAVDVLSIVGGTFGAAAALVSAVYEHRLARRAV